MKQCLFLITDAVMVNVSACQKQTATKLFPFEMGGKTMYVDVKGDIAINPQFEFGGFFYDGLAKVSTNGELFGFVNEKGVIVIPETFKNVTNFKEGIAWVVEKGKAPAAINTKGKILFELKQAEEVYCFSEGLAAFRTETEDGMRWGYVNKKGDVVIEPQFFSEGLFHEGLSIVYNENETFGFIDKKGNIAINYQFDMASMFEGGFAVVEIADKMGTIDKAGKFVINPQYDQLLIDKGMFVYGQDKKYGWLDKNGKILINAQFEQVLPFKESKFAPVLIGKKWGYIDKKGKIVINPQFDSAFPFMGNIAIVAVDDKIGFIDIEGKYEVNPQFEPGEALSYYAINLLYGFDGQISVESDYFNIEKVVNAIDFDNFEGYSIEADFNEIKQKFNLNDSDFSKHQNNSQVKRYYLSSDALCLVRVNGSAYDAQTVTRGSGWWTNTDTEYVFNGTRKINRIDYEINLTNRGVGHELNVINAIQEKLKNYTLDEASNPGYLMYAINGRKLYIEAPDDDNEIQLFFMFE